MQSGNVHKATYIKSFHYNKKNKYKEEMYYISILEIKDPYRKERE